jgi:hypothetical protein
MQLVGVVVSHHTVDRVVDSVISQNRVEAPELGFEPRIP